MQKKVNYFIWAFILFLIIFFMVLAINNNNKIKEFKFTKSKPYNTDVRLYLKDKRKGHSLINALKDIKVATNSLTYLNTLTTTLKLENTSKYLIQVDDDVLVGDYYSSGKYKVATYYSDNTLFKIFDVANKFIMTEDYDSLEYDRIIMIGDLDKVIKIDKDFKEVTELEKQKKIIDKEADLEVYWLKGTKLVTSSNRK